MTPILDLGCSLGAVALVIVGLLWILGTSATTTTHLEAALRLAIVGPIALAIIGPSLMNLSGWWSQHIGEVKLASVVTGAALLIGLHVFLTRRAAQRRPENLSLKKRVE